MLKNVVSNNDLSRHEGIFELYDSMFTDPKLPDVLFHMADVLCEKLHAERATIYLSDDATHELESAALIGNVARSIRIPVNNKSLAGFCALTGRAFVVSDAYGDLSSLDPEVCFDKTWDEINQYRTRDVICAPARFKGEIIGVVQVMNSRGKSFSKAEVPLLEDTARLVGYILHQARLLDDLATLKQLEHEKATFIRIMVHELKSPVNAAKMMIDLLALYPLENPKITHLPERISIRMEQLLELINDMLELARVKSGDPLGDISVLDLVVETEKGCAPYINQAENKGLSISVEYPEEPLQVRFDSQGYALILSNLVSNSVKYTTEGFVKVSLKRQDSWAVLKVTDSGIGIPESDIPQLFKEFFRASNARRQKIQGTGVGLAGVKHIVERFGGEMELQSKENEGSTFTVRLSLYAE